MYKNKLFATVSTLNFTVISSYLTKRLYTIKFNGEEMKFSIDGEVQFACGNVVNIANAILEHESRMLDTEGEKEYNTSETCNFILDGWKAVHEEPSKYQHFVGIAIIDALETAHDYILKF